jgi:peptide deformylase
MFKSWNSSISLPDTYPAHILPKYIMTLYRNVDRRTGSSQEINVKEATIMTIKHEMDNSTIFLYH